MKRLSKKGDLIKHACSGILLVVEQHMELGRAQKKREVRKFHRGRGVAPARACCLGHTGAKTMAPVFEKKTKLLLRGQPARSRRPNSNLLSLGVDWGFGVRCKGLRLGQLYTLIAITSSGVMKSYWVGAGSSYNFMDCV